jgi:signal transduction histidine kinase
MTTILVIEDERDLCSSIVDLLESEGYSTISAWDGVAGMQLAQQHLPDLILCDILMPRLDGYGVKRSLSQNLTTAIIPFIFLTAKIDRADLRLGMELGADDYVTKPFTRAELLRAVEVRLAKRADFNRRFQQKLNDLRNNIAFHMPHELRTPLTGILGGAAILKEELESLDRGQIQEMVNLIYTFAERLNHLAMNFLLYAETEVAAANPEMIAHLRSERTLHAHTVIERAALRVARQAHREGDLELDLRAANAGILERYLAKIVEELLGNACKFSNPGAPIRVRCGSAGSLFHLAVTDCGRGMTAEQIADAGAYMQFDRRLYEQQGTGLGLAITKRLVELHGGELHIESLPAQGTTVSVVLPEGGES